MIPAVQAWWQHLDDHEGPEQSLPSRPGPRRRERKGRPVAGLARVVRELGGMHECCGRFVHAFDCPAFSASTRPTVPSLVAAQGGSAPLVPRTPERRFTVNDSLTPGCGDAATPTHNPTRAQARPTKEH